MCDVEEVEAVVIVVEEVAGVVEVDLEVIGVPETVKVLAAVDVVGDVPG